MDLGLSPPGWVLAVAVLVVAAIAVAAYARPPVAMSWPRRLTLSALRAGTFLIVGFLLLQPIRTDPAPPEDGRVAVLVDRSRSMAIRDDDGPTRLERAVDIVRDDILPALDGFDVELFGFGQALDEAELDRLAPLDDQSDLVGALAALADRNVAQPPLGVIVVSDGADTGPVSSAPDSREPSVPVFTTGVGGRPSRDREVAQVTVADRAAAESSIEVLASIATSGLGVETFDVRLLEDGTLVDVQRVTPASDPEISTVVFRATPDPDVATIYTVELPVDPADLVAGNNRRSVIVRPPARARRVLMVEGAPGYEHTFLKRVWLADEGVSVDAVVRKGANDRGEPTYFVQTEGEEAPPLAGGFPTTREALFRYDAVVLANVEGESFTADQLALLTDFVGTRGGGVLLLGPASLRRGGYLGSSFEQVLPAALVERLGLADGGEVGSGAHRLALTDAGSIHSMMQLGATSSVTRARWADAPPLAGTVRLGAVRPGGSILAVAERPAGDGENRPIVVVQPYGAGRSMLFAGRASWRWQMLSASDDRTYEVYWGQVARWLTANASAPVTAAWRGVVPAGRQASIDVTTRDAAYERVAAASVTVEVVDPTGDRQTATAAPVAARPGDYVATVTPPTAGLYRIEATATRDGEYLGRAVEWALVGGVDPELADPWLDERLLARVAEARGGRFVTADTLAELPVFLREAGRESPRVVTREAWHNVWIYAVMLGFLATEWGLRRIWGLR